MEVFRYQTILTKTGLLTLDSLPFSAGDCVQITISKSDATKPSDNPYPLRGTPYRFPNPFEPVAETDWEVLK